MNKRIQSLKALYLKAKEAKVRAEVKCPSCGTSFTKTHKQQAFCTSKGGTICKDNYWNNVTPSKRNNTTRISPASAAWMAANPRPRYTSEGYRIIDGIAYDEFDDPMYVVDEFQDDDPSWDAHKLD